MINSNCFYILTEYRHRALGEFEVMLYRQQAGFGFRILSGEPGNPRVTIGDIVPGMNASTFFLLIFQNFTKNLTKKNEKKNTTKKN